MNRRSIILLTLCGAALALAAFPLGFAATDTTTHTGGADHDADNAHASTSGHPEHAGGNTAGYHGNEGTDYSASASESSSYRSRNNLGESNVLDILALGGLGGLYGSYYNPYGFGAAYVSPYVSPYYAPAVAPLYAPTTYAPTYASGYGYSTGYATNPLYGGYSTGYGVNPAYGYGTGYGYGSGYGYGTGYGTSPAYGYGTGYGANPAYGYGSGYGVNPAYGYGASAGNAMAAYTNNIFFVGAAPFLHASMLGSHAIAYVDPAYVPAFAAGIGQSATALGPTIVVVDPATNAAILTDTSVATSAALLAPAVEHVMLANGSTATMVVTDDASIARLMLS